MLGAHVGPVLGAGFQFRDRLAAAGLGDDDDEAEAGGAGRGGGGSGSGGEGGGGGRPVAIATHAPSSVDIGGYAVARRSPRGAVCDRAPCFSHRFNEM